MNHTTDIHGKTVIAVGAPGSLARARCEGRIMNTIRFEFHSVHSSNNYKVYLCDSNSDMSGDYYKAEEVQPLIDALKKIQHVFPIGHESPEMTLDRATKYATETLAKFNEKRK
jgi:hypothetical protein